MAKVSLLVDTDIWIDYLNAGHFDRFFESHQFIVYYSVVTRKELLAKRGLKDSERQAILFELKQHRQIELDPSIAQLFSKLRGKYHQLEKEDALIAATAIAKRLPLLTRNWRHYRQVRELRLYNGNSGN